VRYLLDTDTCVYWLRGHEAVRDHVIVVGPEELAMSVVSLAELRYGAAHSARPDQNQRAVDDFVGGMAVVGLTAEAARRFGEVKATLRRDGMLIADLDLLIAATARTFDLILVTDNAGHFGRVPSLSIQSWTKP
jgi:tRNA(fMet)-specific endonuclease VapC